MQTFATAVRAQEVLAEAFGVSILFLTVKAMGLLAAKSDAAYNFVKQGTNPWFWKDTVKWSSKRGRDTVGLLTSSSIQAVGESGRPDAEAFIQQLATQDLVNRTGDSSQGARHFAGDVVQAAFYLYVIRELGMDYFRDNFFGDCRQAAWEQWRRTEVGKQWRDWANQRRAEGR